MKLLDKVKGTLERNKMIVRGDRVLLAVSGGPDSVALLALFLCLEREYELTLTVAHLNHGLRGQESDAEEEFVRKMANKHGVVFASKSLKPGELKRPGVSLEEAAREARYTFLDSVAQQLGANRIALGHTADDQAETVLMNLIRGTGPAGLQGILPIREGKYIRPLIEISRREIEGFLPSQGIEFRVDSSNQNLKFLRNRVRWELLPYLAREFNPRMKERLLALAAIIREENEFLSRLLKENLSKIILVEEEGHVVFNRKTFLLLEPALQFRAIRWAVEMVSGSLRGFDYQHLCQALGLIKGRFPNKVAVLPKGVRIQRRYNEIVVVKEEKPEESSRLNFQYPLPVPGMVEIPEAGLILRAKLISNSEVETLSCGPNVAFLDWDRLTVPLLIRNRKPGDRFQPLGLKGQKKLKDFFIDVKLPPAERKKNPLLVSGQEIAWVVGFRPGEPFKVRPGTRKVLRVEAISQEALPLRS